MSSVTRRQFVRGAVLAAASTQLATSLLAQERAPASRADATAPADTAEPLARWLDGTPPPSPVGTTWGMPWPQGLHRSGTTFALTTDTGSPVPTQSWPLATWPDGSLKWTAHALPADAPAAAQYRVSAGTPAPAPRPLQVSDTEAGIEVDTGVIRVRVARSGRSLIPSVRRGGDEVLRDGRLVLLRRDSPDVAGASEPFEGEIGAVTLEHSGPVRAVIKIEGKHAAVTGSRAWLPFVLRLYLYAGGEALRLVHTLVYDGDPARDAIAGLGVRFAVPMRGELYDRHVRFSGQDDGLFGESVRTVTGLRRDPGEAVRRAQVEGVATPPIDTWNPAAGKRMHWVPAFADWSLYQSSADGFEIQKRTRAGQSWLTSARGRRAGGLGYVGSPQGGVAFGIRNFWQSYPAELAIEGATAEEAHVTAWLWSPRAAPMDLRGYHDGMGQDTYAEQLEALQITYEDYEPGYDSPEGVARTSELYFWALGATPPRPKLAELAAVVRTPPLLAAAPAYLRRCAVFGAMSTPVDRSTPARAHVEDLLDWNFRYYEQQREERRWYGFWHYGDVMHSYDRDRHEWKYDVGGFAWDNSELSTDIWLWLHYLRTGRADVFRFAEAMTRHTGEVDVHHLGRFAPLGSRHNVLHWGCSAKQLRISTAANRRYYYYLTGDERVGDLMREQVEAVRALATVQANRKVSPDRVTAPDPNAREVFAGFGTDWGSAASAWLTEWERTGDQRVRDRLLAGMRTIATQPRGFFTGGARLDLASGAFAAAPTDDVSVSHLSAVFGLVETCAELVQLFPAETAFRQAWLDYCVLYNAPAEEQARRFGRPLKGTGLQQGHARLTAYAAALQEDPALAARAWREFYSEEGSEGRGVRAKPEAQRLTGPYVLQPVEEAPWVSTNGTAQWSLAAMQCLAWAGAAMPQRAP